MDISIAIPVLDDDLTIGCNDPLPMWESNHPSDHPPARLNAQCEAYFGVVYRLHDESGDVVGEHFQQLVSAATFPNTPPAAPEPNFEVKSVKEGSVGAVTVEIGWSMPEDVLLLNDIQVGYPGNVGVWPTVGELAQERRWSETVSDGTDVSFTFDWLPLGSERADFLMRYVYQRALYGRLYTANADAVLTLSMNEHGDYEAGWTSPRTWMENQSLQ
jgi:hypothetical protein